MNCLSFTYQFLRVVFLCLLISSLAPPLLAQHETQHVIDAPWQLTPRVELTLHNRYRTRPTSQGLYQGRVGVVLDVRASARINAIAGYYFRKEEDGPRDLETWNRYFGGAEHTIARWKGKWFGRHLAEWFDGPDSVAYYRVRHSFGYEAPTRLSPYYDVEVFWDQHGWRGTRYRAGLRYQFTPRTAWDFHYFHEPRRQDVGWRPRNMWGTTLEVQLGKIEQTRK